MICCDVSTTNISVEKKIRHGSNAYESSAEICNTIIPFLNLRTKQMKRKYIAKTKAN